MSDEARPDAPAPASDAAGRPGRRQLAGNPASAIYGTIVTAGLLATERAGDHGVARLTISVTATLLVFWLAHAYTDLLGGAITHGRPTGRSGLWHALRVEWPIVESGVLPIAALLIADAAGAAGPGAVLAALVTAVVEMCGWAVLASRRMDLELLPRLTFVVASGLFGVAIIVLKAVIH